MIPEMAFSIFLKTLRSNRSMHRVLYSGANFLFGCFLLWQVYCYFVYFYASDTIAHMSLGWIGGITLAAAMAVLAAKWKAVSGTQEDGNQSSRHPRWIAVCALGLACLLAYVFITCGISPQYLFLHHSRQKAYSSLWLGEKEQPIAIEFQYVRGYRTSQPLDGGRLNLSAVSPNELMSIVVHPDSIGKPFFPFVRHTEIELHTLFTSVNLTVATAILSSSARKSGDGYDADSEFRPISSESDDLMFKAQSIWSEDTDRPVDLTKPLREQCARWGGLEPLFPGGGEQCFNVMRSVLGENVVDLYRKSNPYYGTNDTSCGRYTYTIDRRSKGKLMVNVVLHDTSCKGVAKNNLGA